MQSIPASRLVGLLALSLFALAACEQSDSPTAVDHLSAHAASAVPNAAAQAAKGAKPGAMLLAARKSTSRFHATTQAMAAGHAPEHVCVAHPQLGGMGQHWVNSSLIDPVFDPSRPEALLYEPSSGNKAKLVGVEYIVIDVGQPRPAFDGHLFDIGGVPPLMAAGVPHWSLHVWVHRDNPNGLYTPFNPKVKCN